MHKYEVSFYYNTDECCSSIVEASGELQALALAMANQKITLWCDEDKGLWIKIKRWTYGCL